MRLSVGTGIAQARHRAATRAVAAAAAAVAVTAATVRRTACSRTCACAHSSPVGCRRPSTARDAGVQRVARQQDVSTAEQRATRSAAMRLRAPGRLRHVGDADLHSVPRQRVVRTRSEVRVPARSSGASRSRSTGGSSGSGSAARCFTGTSGCAGSISIGASTSAAACRRACRTSSTGAGRRADIYSSATVARRNAAEPRQSHDGVGIVVVVVIIRSAIIDSTHTLKGAVWIAAHRHASGSSSSFDSTEAKPTIGDAHLAAISIGVIISKSISEQGRRKEQQEGEHSERGGASSSITDIDRTRELLLGAGQRR